MCVFLNVCFSQNVIADLLVLVLPATLCKILFDLKHLLMPSPITSVVSKCSCYNLNKITTVNVMKYLVKVKKG